MADTSSSNNKVIKLESRWTFYYDKPQRGQATKYNDEVKQLGTFDTVQDFWRYWNNLDISKLPINSNLRLFKEGIQPCWEDPANSNGGKWVMVRDKDENASRAWLVCVLTLIGEQFTNGDDMCGTVLSLRAQGNNISVWNRSSSDKEKLDTTERELSFFMEVQREKIRYQPHRDLMVMNNLSFNIKLSRSVELPNHSPSKSMWSSIPSTLKSTQEENDFVTPFIDLDSSGSKANHVQHNNHELPHKGHRRSNSVVSDRWVVHRKTQSYNDTAVDSISQSQKNGLLRLTASIDSDSFRMWHNETPKTYQLPKRHRRKGKRLEVSDIPLSDLPSLTNLSIPNFVPSEQPQTKMRAKSASCVIPAVHRIRSNMDTIPEVPIILTTKHEQRSPIPPHPPKGVLGISFLYWLALFAIMISASLLFIFLFEKTLPLTS